MTNWQNKLLIDPISSLLNKNDPIVEYFTRRDLLEEKVGRIEDVWNSSEVQKVLRQQQPNGSWKSKTKNRDKHPAINHDLIETWKQFRYLIDQYQMNKTVPSIEKAAEFIFSCQAKEGDIRGILGNQYAAYYTGALMSLLIKSGYQADPRIERGFKWLLSVRQSDGGWLANALMTMDLSWKEVTRLTSQKVETISYSNFSEPSSHNWTGMVIRAFAAHPKFRNSKKALKAAELLKSKFFQKDPHYSSYQDAGYWVRFQYPFWWNNLVSALDSISLIGLSPKDGDIKKALIWLQTNQQKNGLWLLSYSPKHQIRYNNKAENMQLWLTLAICRIFKRFFHQSLIHF